MTRVGELIAELARGGVEVRALGEVATLVRGNGMPKSDLTESGVGAIHYGQIYTRYGVWTDETLSFVAPNTATKLARVDPGDLIITNTSENVEDVGKAVAWLGERQIVTGGHATVIKHDQDPKYLAYWFQSESFSVQKRALASGAKVIDVSAKQLARVRVPLPPIEAQREIARVLDELAAAEGELEALLAAEQRARTQQFETVRDAILTFAEFPRVALGAVGEFVRGRRFTKSDVVDDGIPSIHYGEIYTTYGVATERAISRVRKELATRLRYAQPGDVVVAAVGETVEDVGKAVAWLGCEPVAIHDDTFKFRSDLNPKYVSYFMQTADFHRQKNKYVARAKVKRLSGESLAKISIPVPSPEEQSRVVVMLDKFDAFVNALNIGLPTEIAARRKQYEYYRDRLLSFDEVVA